MRGPPRHRSALQLTLLVVVDRILIAFAIVLALSLTYAAWQNVSWGYDIWYYHLPFAARLTGLMDASTYAFSHANAARYEGFPLFAELLQGIFWRLTGRIEAANLVALGSLFGLIVFLWRMFKVPPHIALIALFAIPLVHIHATSSYVDLTANAFATMLLLCVYRVLVIETDEAPSLRLLCGCALLAAATANSKFQLVPTVVMASIVLLVVSLVRRKSEDRRATTKRLLVFALAIPIVFFTPIKNGFAHKNPVWPVELGLLGHTFPFVDKAYSQSPPHLENSPRFVRFARSALEIDNRPIASHGRWSLDQWAPSDDPSCRMGGYFGGYVLVNLIALLGFAAYRRRSSRETIMAAAVMGGVTVVASMVPQSHELRYYMHWMLLLVSLNLIVFTADTDTDTDTPPTKMPRRTMMKWLAAGIASLALAIVTWSTNGGYLYASGSTFDQFLAKNAEPSVIDQAAPKERLCIQREPFTFLYAPRFHQKEKDYAVQEATSPDDCQGARLIP